MCGLRNIDSDSWGQATFLRGTNQGWVYGGNTFGQHRRIRMLALMPIGVGIVNVDYRYDIDILDAEYQFGITNRRTAGFHIPYYWIKNRLRRRLILMMQME